MYKMADILSRQFWPSILSPFLFLGILYYFPTRSLAGDNCNKTNKSYMVNQRSRLAQCMLINYRTHVRPIQNIKNSTEVAVEFAAMDIRFNSKYKMFYIMGIIKVDWTDELLAWDPAEFGDIDLTQIESSSIWTPPLFYEGIVGSPFNSLFSNTMTDVRSGGHVSYMNFVTFKSMCRSQVVNFPRDEHECVVRIETLELLKFRLVSTDGLNTKDMTIIEFVNIMMAGYSMKAQVFEMFNVTLSIEEYQFSDSSNSQDVVIQVKFRRNTSRLSALYLEAFTISLLMLVTLLVPATSVVRMSLHLVAFFGSLYGIDRIDNIVNIYTVEDVPMIIIYYRNIILMSLFMLGESFLYLLLSEQPLQLPGPLEKLYNYVTQHSVYKKLDMIHSLNIRPNNEKEYLVGATNMETRHTSKDLIQVVDTYTSYLLIMLITTFYVKLII